MEPPLWYACETVILLLGALPFHTPPLPMLIIQTMSADRTDEHVKTVYAHYGLALYLAQCLEHGLANALVYIDLIPRKSQAVRTREEWTAEFDSFLGRSFEQTLGRLIRTLGEATAVPAELQGRLTSALRQRNW